MEISVFVFLSSFSVFSVNNNNTINLKKALEVVQQM